MTLFLAFFNNVSAKIVVTKPSFQDLGNTYENIKTIDQSQNIKVATQASAAAYKEESEYAPNTNNQDGWEVWDNQYQNKPKYIKSDYPYVKYEDAEGLSLIDNTISKLSRETLVKQYDLLINFYATPKDGESTRAGILLFRKNSHGDGDIILAFHGTQDMSDVKVDLNFPMMATNSIGLKEGYAHQGFLQRYMESRESITDILQLFASEIAKDKRLNVMVTGHSLGGALAQIAAIDLNNNILPTLHKNANIELITFNAPRAFDFTAAAGFNKILGDKTIRLWRSHDPVSAVAPGLMGFKHVGLSCKMPSKYTNPAANHGLDLMYADAHSEECIVPDTDHVGIRNTIKSKVQSLWGWFTQVGK